MYNTESIPGRDFWVKVKNLRTGYTHTVERTKAWRLINQRPQDWKVLMPTTFKDTYELV